MTNKIILVALMILPVRLGWGQQGQSPVTPLAKCIIPFTINSTGTGAQGHFQPSTTGYDNRQTGCTNWNLVYSSTGYTVISLHFESAPALSNVAPGTPGTYVDFAGTIVSGVNPQTATTQTPASGPIFSGYYPWIRLNASTLTGTGQITGVLIGTLPINVTGGAASSGGCVGTAGTPCRVAGPDNIGSAPTFAPVYIAGLDTNSVVQSIKVDSNGKLIPPTFSDAGVDGQSNLEISLDPGTQIPIFYNTRKYIFNGSTLDREFACTLSVPISTSASGTTELVALASSQIIRVCNINWVSASPISVSLVTGHGSACATGQANLTGIYANTTSVDFNFGGTLRGAASEALCIKLGTAVSTTGVLTYAQF